MQQPHEVHIIHEEQILEAIDQLRRRKARPDADRICNYLLRKFSVDVRDTIADLHRLIEAEKVIQVDYKGNTSYRNASKWSRLQLYKNRPEGFVKEKLNSNMMASAFAELLVEEPDYLDQGVPAFRLIEQLLDGISNPTSRKMVEDFLAKEVSSGNVTRMSNGNYSLVGTSDVTGNTSFGNGKEDTGHSVNKPRRYSSETGDSGKDSILRESNSDFFGFDDGGNYDSRSDNTPRSSRQASPKDDIGKKDESNVIEKDVEGKEAEKERKKKENEPKDQNKEEERCLKSGESVGKVKKSSKSERKQRLLVRPDDSMDLEIKFEHFVGREEKDRRGRRRNEGEEEHSEEREDEETGRSSNNQSPTGGTFGGFRSARRKRAKKVFDPSDTDVPKRKRGRQPLASKTTFQASHEYHDINLKATTKEGPNRQCSLCAKDKSESLVACRDCTVRAHPGCIWSPEDLIHKAGSSWQCERCKTCSICCETSETGALITCIACDEAYHYVCHTPRVPSSKSHSKWHCSNCAEKKLQKMTPVIGLEKVLPSRPETPINPPQLPPVLSPQVSPTRGLIDHNDDEICPRDGIDPNIPDASDWTSEQVYQYFARLFPKEAEVFRLQDIDGHSLLLLKRSDVLIGLDLLLGPALKIYRHVLKLQMRRDDPRFYWL
ncbi:uncharacterized protein DDB_G0284459 [Fopius arisanus]|uniref:SAMD1_0 protein n=1 Tax=Fopius arisanus TaxID=64838 RepID=A0A0C9QMU6_9HYME|nr:PREDICTED: uncharacterized protein DDB_G0284459 [Fopius arisanus]XP_011312882.1 PREDICTED: uncharacterized protein DDB_G0284459 [Fopius arisanus]XP_011312883.1 PREDICTED: uncharacterized protein DDB_G0284459 [Fopius arisanus]XP_011312884.1 PREDICTED: uncharacterized protein DDB_G0284459 [Fopius arisanus]XP_011312885.1 PREDICTED: uncharacterized protein DDB_G0284459 [Fopius arisanus]